MTDSTAPQPFQLQVAYDQDELLGARWWHKGMVVPAVAAIGGGTASLDESRRRALKVMIGLGAGIVFVGVASSRCTSRTHPQAPVTESSLLLQRQHGLMHAANGASFQWPDAVAVDATGVPFQRGRMLALATELRPQDPSWHEYYVPTLLSALAAPGSGALTDSATPIRSAAMQTAFARGEAMRELLEFAEHPERGALVVDLPGPESVAFAAALQTRATAVFLFDNWPHPRGVVPAHLTIGALLYHGPQFTAARPAAARPPVFVLDRKRLAPYGNEPDRFDNRYRVHLPNGTTLRTHGIERVLYVVPDGAPAEELDDLNETFVAWRSEGIDVRLLGVGDFQPAGTAGDAAARPVASGGAGSGTNGGTRYFWGGSPRYHGSFWNHYGWRGQPPGGVPQPPPRPMSGDGYRPTLRGLRSNFDQIGRTTTSRGNSGSSGSSGGSGGSWGRSSGGSGA